MRIELHRDAIGEMDASAAWYMDRSPAAAAQFVLSVEKALGQITGDWESFPRIDARHRACSLAGFPFQIVFRVTKDRLLVIAVAHAKRRPGHWRKRS